MNTDKKKRERPSSVISGTMPSHAGGEMHALL